MSEHTGTEGAPASKFAGQLAVVRANLERVEALYAQMPDLFQEAGSVYLDAESVKVFIHVNGDPAWREVAAAHRDAGWKRDSSAAYPGAWDWRGVLCGVELVVIGAERRPEPTTVEFEVVQ